MAEITPAIEQPIEPTLPSLPTHGRPITTRQKIALGAAALAAATTAAGCEFFPFFASKTNPSASPSAIVEQSSSPIPTPISSENPTIAIPSKSPTKSQSETPSATPSPVESPTATPTPTKTPEASASVEPASKLEKDLQSWLDGTYPIPKLFTFTGSTKALPINTIEDPSALAGVEYHHSSSTYQGIFLGYEVVNNHLIVYWGEKDAKNVPYYFASTEGDISDPNFFNYAATGITDPLGAGDGASYNYPDIVNFLRNAIGKDCAFNLYSENVGTNSDPKFTTMLDEINNQAAFTHDFNRFSSNAGWVGSYKSSPYHTEASGIINQRIKPTNFDATKIPYLQVVKTR